MPTPIPADKKLKISDLKYHDPQWNSIVKLLHQDCNALLHTPLILTKALIDNQTEHAEGIDAIKLRKMVSNIAKDNVSLNNEYRNIVSLVETRKKELHGGDTLDIGVEILNLTQQVVEWMIRYEEVIVNPVFDIVDYVNSVVEDTKKINMVRNVSVDQSLTSKPVGEV